MVKDLYPFVPEPTPHKAQDRDQLLWNARQWGALARTLQGLSGLPYAFLDEELTFAEAVTFEAAVAMEAGLDITGEVDIIGGLSISGDLEVGGTLNAGALPTDTAAANWVRARIATSAIDAVGSYAFLGETAPGGGIGANKAGSDLRWSNAGAAATASPFLPSGTWRRMGRTTGSTNFEASLTTLWLRVA